MRGSSSATCCQSQTHPETAGNRDSATLWGESSLILHTNLTRAKGAEREQNLTNRDTPTLCPTPELNASHLPPFIPLGKASQTAQSSSGTPQIPHLIHSRNPHPQPSVQTLWLQGNKSTHSLTWHCQNHSLCLPPAESTAGRAMATICCRRSTPRGAASALVKNILPAEFTAEKSMATACCSIPTKKKPHKDVSGMQGCPPHTHTPHRAHFLQAGLPKALHPSEASAAKGRGCACSSAVFPRKSHS